MVIDDALRGVGRRPRRWRCGAEDHVVIQVMPGGSSGRGEVGRLCWMLALPLRPQAVDVAVVQLEDRVIGGGHIAHGAPDIAVYQVVHAVLRLETPARARACCRAFPGRSGVGRGADGITDIARSRQTWRRAIRTELTLQVSSIARLILYDQRPAGRSSEGKRGRFALAC